MWRKENPGTLLMGMQIDAATVENSMEVSQKTKNRTTYDPAIPLLGLYPKELEAGTQISAHPCPQHHYS